MSGYVPRKLHRLVERRLKQFPVVAILGPRQCGKTWLAQRITAGRKARYLDLETQADRNKLRDPRAYFVLNADKLICLDEIQRVPGIFEEIRGHVDSNRRPGQFLILGSASRDLIQQSSETLAGRIAHMELTPFTLDELLAYGLRPPAGVELFRELWLRGGFPLSTLADGTEQSLIWRHEFTRTFLERDLTGFGRTINTGRMTRLWQMLAHMHGGLLNASSLGESLGVSHHTVRAYLDLLEQTFMVRVLTPFAANLKKRLVKSPRVYIRDSGILHALLDIRSHEDLLGHPIYGASWEGFVIEQILAACPDVRASFFRTKGGAEVDLVLERGRKRIAVECKATSFPRVGRGFRTALVDLGVDEALVVAPVDEAYLLEKKVQVIPLDKALTYLHEIWSPA